MIFALVVALFAGALLILVPLVSALVLYCFVSISGFLRSSS